MMDWWTIVAADVTGLVSGAGCMWLYFNQIHFRRLLRERDEAMRLQAKAEEALRLKTDFLAVISHELRTPLNALNGFADLLLTGQGVEGGPVQGDHYDLVARIKANGTRLLWGVNDILQLSKLEAGRIEIVLAPFSIRELVASLRLRMESLATEKGLEFSCQVDEDVPFDLIGDAIQIEHILVNLVGNAIKFTQAGRVHIWVSLRGTDKWALRVTDTGCGIEQSRLNEIFQPFVQVDGGTQHPHGGTGLGLTISQELARLMGGYIRVEKTQVGKGSTFVLVLHLIRVGDDVELVEATQ